MKQLYSNSFLVETAKIQLKTPDTQAHYPLDTRRLPQKNPSSNTTTFLIGWMLRSGVILSAAVTLIGLLLLLAQPGELTQQSLQFFPHTLGQVWTGLLALQPQAIIASGLLLLIATPVLSVTASVVGFAIEHDRHYLVIALVVLTTLIASFLMGKGG